MKGFGYYLASLVLVLALLLSSCAAPKAPASAPTPAPAAAKPSQAAPQLSREQKLIEGAKKEASLAWWVFGGLSESGAGVVKAFREKYPFLEVKVWDTRGPEMVVKLLEEAKAGRHTVDVIYISEKHLVVNPLWKEVIAEYEWPSTGNWPFPPGHNYYRAIVFSPKVSSYITPLVTGVEAPRSWEDLNNTKWRGKAVMSVSTSDVPLQFAYMWGKDGQLNWDKSFSFWREVVGNVRPRVITGMPQELHVAGESPLFIMNSLGEILKIKAKGALVEVVPAPMSPATPLLAAIVKNAPHPNAARLFADYLTSYEGQLILGVVALNPIAHPEASKKARANVELASKGVPMMVVPLEFNTPENNRKSDTFWLGLLGR